MENQKNNGRQASEEIEMGQLFELIKRGFSNLFRAFLRLYLYLKKNALKLGILVVSGLVVGFGLSQIVSKELKTEIIVKPNLDSKTYLYDVISELEANLKSKDTAFFGALDIEVARLEGFKVEIHPVDTEEVDDLTEEVKYLELLDKFRDEEGILDVIQNEIMKKSMLNHRIVFYYKDSRTGRDVATKLMKYINSNEYYNELVVLHTENAETRIRNNQTLVAQIDELVSRYTLQLGGNERPQGTYILSDEERINLPGLLRLKNELIRDTEMKRLEIQRNKDAIRIISFGKTQQVIKPFFGEIMIFVPTLLVVLFLLFDFSKYLNRRARELQLQ